MDKKSESRTRGVRSRLEEENRRQDKRYRLLEENEQIGALTISVEKLALSIESMVKEQESQGGACRCWRGGMEKNGELRPAMC